MTCSLSLLERMSALCASFLPCQPNPISTRYYWEIHTTYTDRQTDMHTYKSLQSHLSRSESSSEISRGGKSSTGLHDKQVWLRFATTCLLSALPMIPNLESILWTILFSAVTASNVDTHFMSFYWWTQSVTTQVYFAILTTAKRTHKPATIGDRLVQAEVDTADDDKALLFINSRRNYFRKT